MADNNIVINPEDPTPIPAPQPVPGPTPPTPVPIPNPAKVSPEDVKKNLELFIKVLRGLTFLMPESVKNISEKLASVLDILKDQAWVYEVVSDLLNRFSGKPEELRAAIFHALVLQGEKHKDEVAK